MSKDKSYWMSWVTSPLDGPWTATLFSMLTPWWVEEVQESDDAVFHAAVRAPSEEEAWVLIGLSSFDGEKPTKRRFCEEKPDSWSPFNERFTEARAGAVFGSQVDEWLCFIDGEDVGSHITVPPRGWDDLTPFQHFEHETITFRAMHPQGNLLKWLQADIGRHERHNMMLSYRGEMVLSLRKRMITQRTRTSIEAVRWTFTTVPTAQPYESRTVKLPATNSAIVERLTSLARSKR